MSTGAADGYEGGVGGKLRRKLPRRAAATPYDRPPAAGRGLRGAGIETSLSLVEGGRKRGWLSKLVDPASTLITKGATRLFSSVFRKRLGAPPAAESPVQTLESGEVVADAFDSNHLLNTQERETNDVQDIHDGSDISEFELLLKQKTFTRDEYDRLTELLRSRTVDISNEEDVRRTRQSTSTPAMDYSTPETEKFTSQISEEELASPAEVAKAYMGSRPSKVSPSSLSLRSQVLRETTTVSPTFAGFTPKLMAPPLPSKSVVQFPGLRAAQDNGYTTPVSRGRSAIYRMSRSPYFRAPPTIPIKEDGKIDDVHAGPSQWTPRSLALSSSKQVLKRRSTVLESNIGSVGPIRRIRQKSNLFTPMTSASNTTELSSSKSKIETLENGEKRSDYVPVPTQSREMAKKILQQLDKLVPSPKDKPSETKTVFRDESPSKLTVNMLHGQALKSFTEKDLSKLFNAEANGPVPSTKSQLEFSVPSTDSIIRSKAASEAQMMETVAETRVVEPLPKKSIFKMQVPVELLDHDNDDFPGRDDSNAFTAKKPFFAASQISEVKLSRTLTTNGLEVAKKDTGFTFPVSSAPAIDTHLPPTPTMPSAPTLSAGADTMPVFSFSSKTTPLTFSSTLANSAAASETKQQSPENRPSISKLEKSEKTREPGFLFKSAPTTSNTTSLFGGSFTSTTQSNGSPLPMTPSLFSPPSPVAFTTPSFQFSTPTSKDSAPQPVESVFGLRAKDSESKPSRESVFSMPTSATTTTTTDFASKPSNDSIFSLPTSTTLATDFAPKPSKDSLFSLPTSAPITTTGTDFAPKPLKESIFSLPTSTSMTSAGDFASKPSKESMFTLPPPAATTMSTATDFAQKPSKESIFSLSTSAPMTTTVSTGFTPKPSKESIFSLPASTDSTPKPASESIFGLSTSTTTSAPTFSSGGGSIFGGTGASSLFSQSTASQFTPSGSSNSIFGAAASSQSAAMPSSIFGSSFGAASSAPAFSYPQAAAPASPPVFGFSSPFKVASASPGNDQMSVEDSMADDSVVAAPTPAAAPSMPVFGGTTATPVFPFGSPQPVTFMPNPQPPFQTGAATEFQGNFSMGSGGGGGDKSGRRFIKAKRDKHRKK